MQSPWLEDEATGRKLLLLLEALITSIEINSNIAN